MDKSPSSLDFKRAGSPENMSFLGGREFWELHRRLGECYETDLRFCLWGLWVDFFLVCGGGVNGVLKGTMFACNRVRKVVRYCYIVTAN